jgi:lysophospholipase L1-like esterase
MSGKTTRHHIIALKYLPLKKLKIDAVILLVGINDFSKRLSRDKHYNPAYMTRPEANEQLLAETFKSRNLKDPDVFFHKSKILQLLRKLKKMKSRQDIQDHLYEAYIKWRKHRRNAAEIRDKLPDLSSALNEYANNINTIVDLSEENGIRLISMTQPAMWKSGLSKDLQALLWLGGIGDFQKKSGKAYYSVEALEKGLKFYNDILLRISQKRDVECINLASMLKKDTTVFYDDVHFNESGARQVAEILSDYISHTQAIQSNADYLKRPNFVNLRGPPL